MDALPLELVCHIVEHVDVLTLPVLRCVGLQWYHLVDVVRPHFKHKAHRQKGTGETHVCTLNARCAMRYAQKLVDRGRRNLLDWMQDLARDDIDGPMRLHDSICVAAASVGDLKHLQGQAQYRIPERAYKCASRYGHLNVLQWALDTSALCTVDVCKQAAKGGHIHVLEWAMANRSVKLSQRCPCSPACVRYNVECPHKRGFTLTESACAAAARRGDLEMLQWLRAKGCPWDSTTCERAAQQGRLCVLEWARAQGCPWNWGSSVCCRAAKAGHLHVIKWARDNRCLWSPQICAAAAGAGHLAVLQWARANGCPWNEETCAHAARNGHLHVLQWLRANDCEWGIDTCREAARNGHLEVLQWARANGCPWDGNVMAYAAKEGHVAILEWAHANGCPKSDVCHHAAMGGRLDVLKWAVTKGFALGEDLHLTAAQGVHLTVLEWLRANDCPMPKGVYFVGVAPIVCRWFAKHYAEQEPPQ